METIYLAAALALCAHAHVDCRKMDSLDFEFKINNGPEVVGTVGDNITGPHAFADAAVWCKQRMTTRGHQITLSTDETIRAVPMYLYKMYNGHWGTSFNCVREKLVS